MRVGMMMAAVACAMVVMAMPEVAQASSPVLTKTCDIVMTVWLWIRSAVYVLAAIALAFMSFQASILGRFAMGRLVVWGGALFALSSAPWILGFLTDSTLRLTCPA